jgi:hypothetical protein
MVSSEELRRLVESKGFEALEMLRAFDNAYHSFKYHTNSLWQQSNQIIGLSID